MILLQNYHLINEMVFLMKIYHIFEKRNRTCLDMALTISMECLMHNYDIGRTL